MAKKGIGGKVAGWAFGKVRKPEYSELGRNVLSEGMTSARQSLAPIVFDRTDFLAGYHGRYADGGVARFSEMMRQQRLKEVDLIDIAGTHMAIARLYAGVTAAVILISVLFTALGSGQFSVLGALVLWVFSFAFLAVAVRHDFSAWQIRSRRFAGFRDYLDLRFSRRT